MKTIEVEFETIEGKVWRDWVPERSVDMLMDEVKHHGITFRVIGEVSWQRQLARMENPTL